MNEPTSSFLPATGAESIATTLDAHAPVSDSPMSALNFLRESLRNIKTVGTVTRSSAPLCRAAIKPVDFATARHIVELGAGDGVITKHILAKMHPEARLMAFEVNPAFCEEMRTINDARLFVVQDSAELLAEYLQSHHFEALDAVVSAIPFVSLPESLADKIVTLCREALRPGAPFSQVHYTLVRKKVYAGIFGNVKIEFVPVNIPPAFVLTSRK